MSVPGTTAGLDRWWQEHSELDARVERVIETLGRGAIAAAAEALEEFAEALESHFGLEEGSYFPLVERALPDLRGPLEAARLAHRRIRERLEDLRALVERGDLRAARAGLDVLLALFHTHEDEEAGLIARLEALSDE